MPKNLAQVRAVKVGAPLSPRMLALSKKYARDKAQRSALEALIQACSVLEPLAQKQAEAGIPGAESVFTIF